MAVHQSLPAVKFLGTEGDIGVGPDEQGRQVGEGFEVALKVGEKRSGGDDVVG